MDFDDLVTALEPPPNRVGKSRGAQEHHLYEGAVMVTYAMHLLRTQSARDIRIHPDGEHAKIFEIVPFLERRGFRLAERIGTTNYGGSYVRGAETLIVRPLIQSLGLVTLLHVSATTSSRPSARAVSSTRGIQARCLDYTEASAKPSEC